jgi:acyl-CoA thioester hydrolase
MKFEEFELRHRHEIRVRYADTDKMGIVYNGSYFTYFEVGRTELMRNCGLPYTEFEREGYLLPLTETKAEFKSSAFYDDLLTVEAILMVRYSPVVRFDYNIFRGDTTIAIGYTTHSFVNATSRKPVRPPEMFYKAVMNFHNR